MVFHFLDKDMMKKIITTMIKSKLEYAKVIWSPHKKKHVLNLEKIQRIKKKMHLTTLKERGEKGELITIYKLMSNLEETKRKDLLL